MNDDEQKEGEKAFAKMVRQMLNTDFAYVMRLIASAQEALEEDQMLDSIEPETKIALEMVSRQAWECRLALQAVIDFHREYHAQREEAN